MSDPAAAWSGWVRAAIVVQIGDRTTSFAGDFIIGRQGADLMLDDEYASTVHARCTNPDGWYVEDMGSTNGTWLNGQRVYGPTRLGKGDRLKVGRTVMIVVPT